MKKETEKSGKANAEVGKKPPAPLLLLQDFEAEAGLSWEKEMPLCGYNTGLGNFSTEVIVFLWLKVIGDLLLPDSGFKMMGLTKILVKW